ncbi:TBC1 domain family member 19-like isoform X2 [Dermacentor silvarum]|uniref:TBC1 domain family member 19-like isoform X2 n=1 Tax=Dermacentor silvarum TaxID=543639 RepID=UPI0021012D13|nr:TBC1 domain family member 19-like isoform X2 [Dermacentor silvarum]
MESPASPPPQGTQAELQLGTGYEVLDHLQRVITKTPGADSSILNILGDELYECDDKECVLNNGYCSSSSHNATTGESNADETFLDELQNIWHAKLIECLKDTAKQFGLPLSRKRTIGEQELVESRWFDLGSEEIELLAVEPLYTPQDFLDFLLSPASNEDEICFVSGNTSFLAQASVALKTKDICELREMLKTPSYEAPKSQDLDSAEYQLFAQLIYDTSDQLAAREFLKRGCPHCMRRLFWARVLGISSAEKVNAEFDGLKERVIRYELLVDQIIIKDVRDTVMNDIEYFAFDDSCYQVMLAFTRDYYVARRISNNSLGTVILRADLPCGAVPYYGFSLLVSPLCFMYADVGIMYAVFREMYCRYFHKLMAISSDPQGIVSLLLTFERLVQYREPEFLPALASKNVNLQPIVFQMLMQSFCAHLPAEEVLRLWDRVLGYDSVYVLPVAAASLVCSKKTEILGTRDQSSLEDIFNKLMPCDVISTLDDFLKPPSL